MKKSENEKSERKSLRIKNLRVKKSENENLRIEKSENGKSETNYNLVSFLICILNKMLVSGFIENKSRFRDVWLHPSSFISNKMLC